MSKRGGDKALPMVMHKASRRIGWLVSIEHRRWIGGDGAWVLWDDHPRPSWHPIGVIVAVER